MLWVKEGQSHQKWVMKKKMLGTIVLDKLDNFVGFIVYVV